MTASAEVGHEGVAMDSPHANPQGGPMLAADGTPLKKSLRRALRREKFRALSLVAPLLAFVLLTFVAPIADMLFRSVENDIVSDTLPRVTASLRGWDHESGEAPDVAIYEDLTYDLAVAVERKLHTRLGTRLNYERTGVSSLFRKIGRRVEDFGGSYAEQFSDLDDAWADPSEWSRLMALPEAEAALPKTASLYRDFADFTVNEGDDPAEEMPWNAVFLALHSDLTARPDAGDALPEVPRIGAAAKSVSGFATENVKAKFLDVDEEWGDVGTWATIKAFSPKYTPGYFLASVDLKRAPEGIERQPEDQRIYLLLFQRTLFMSLAIMGFCILLGYPVAYLLASLPLRTSAPLLILVLLPFWTSLLVRTSAWKVLLQQQGVINDVLVWIGLVADDGRLALINNQFGTIAAMTHILLPFMILPLYSVMKTIPPSYVRAAKSLGATDWTAFWRVYFPQSVPGIGAGCILVFILAIGYYITPELVGGTTGTFISNRIAYHVSTSLNWGLAAALGTLLLGAVLILYWVYDRIVGVDNVSLG